MLVWPDPGIQPVTTITMSPDLKNPLAFPEEVGEHKQRGSVSKTKSWHKQREIQTAHTHTLTYIHAKVDSVVYIVGPDRSRKRVEEGRKHPS